EHGGPDDDVSSGLHWREPYAPAARGHDVPSAAGAGAGRGTVIHTALATASTSPPGPRSAAPAASSPVMTSESVMPVPAISAPLPGRRWRGPPPELTPAAGVVTVLSRMSPASRRSHHFAGPQTMDAGARGGG